jgi:AcrR family transcriptional regulator
VTIVNSPAAGATETQADVEPAWRQERRSRIVAAAAELFHKSAYQTVQMDDIARLAGVGKPTLYRYFEAKDELFLVVFDNLLRDLEAEIGAVLRAGGSQEQIVGELVTLLFRRLSTRATALSILSGDHAGVTPRFRHLFAQRRENLLELLKRALHEGHRAGVLKDLDVEAVAPMLIGLVRGGLLAAPDLAPERLAAAAIDMVLHGTLSKH